MATAAGCKDHKVLHLQLLSAVGAAAALHTAVASAVGTDLMPRTRVMHSLPLPLNGPS